MRASFASQQLLNKVELAVGFNFLNTKLIATVLVDVYFYDLNFYLISS